MNPAQLAAAGRATHPVDGLLLGLIKDERDLPVVRLWAVMAFVLLPVAVALYVWTLPWWVHAAYVAAAIYLLPPYILALHVSTHRGVFKPRYRWLQTAAVWLLGPLAGQSPETYRVHHMGMHHVEGNLEDDLSSTMGYQRDRLDHFLHYFFRFFFFIPFELGRYQYQRGRIGLLKRMLVGELTYVAAVALLLWWAPAATLTVFVVPFITARFGMMCGNWAQHAFIDPQDPGNPYRNSITCIDCDYNRRCFNDGFHIGHHVKPNRHWSEMPADYVRERSVYRENQSVVFRGVDYFAVWVLLMTRRHRALAQRMVDWDEVSIEDRVSFLRSRLKPVPSDL
jgi:fatty acid desaturase